MNVMEILQYVKKIEPIDTYTNRFPNSAGDCAFVRLNEGGAPNKYMSKLLSPSVQYVIRHKSASEAERISSKIWEHFHNRSHFEIGGSYVYSSTNEQAQPIYLDQDDNGRTIYSINVTCKLRR